MCECLHFSHHHHNPHRHQHHHHRHHKHHHHRVTITSTIIITTAPSSPPSSSSSPPFPSAVATAILSLYLYFYIGTSPQQCRLKFCGFHVLSPLHTRAAKQRWAKAAKAKARPCGSLARSDEPKSGGAVAQSEI